MAVPVMPRAGRLAMLAAGAWLAAAQPAAALGPARPFTPPTAPATATATATPPEAADPAAAASGLAGVRLGSSPRALIDGEWVALGAPARQGRLVQVRAHEAVLRLPNGALERLPLFPPSAAPAEPPFANGPSIVKRDLP